MEHISLAYRPNLVQGDEYLDMTDAAATSPGFAAITASQRSGSKPGRDAAAAT
jgi:hypothetical protein